MIWQFDLLLFAILVLSAALAIRVRDLLATVAVLAAYSLFVALLLAGAGAVDVAFVEAVLGSAFVGILFLAAVFHTGRGPARPNRRGRLVVLPLIAAFAALMLVASTDLPGRGDPEAPAHQRVSPAYLAGALDETETPNVVTALLADYRSGDTLGETLVILTAALTVVLVLRASSVRRVDGAAATAGADAEEGGT